MGAGAAGSFFGSTILFDPASVRGRAVENDGRVVAAAGQSRASGRVR
jgi:hypothetical protein